MKNHIKLTPAEIQSGHSRQAWAEGLVRQLPTNHDGRNSWLLNFGTSEEAERMREDRELWLDPDFDAVAPGHCHVAGTMTGKPLDTCSKCGRDIRHPIHAGQL